MGTIRSSPAVIRASQFLRAQLQKGAWQPGEALPPIRSLAPAAEVSINSMMLAVAHLKSSGEINGVERGRTRAGAHVPAIVPPPSSCGTICHLKRREMENDLMAGVFAASATLPSSKELESKYGVGYRTMRKILRSLVEDKVIDLRGKKYVIRGESRTGSSRRLVFITNRTTELPSSALNQGHYRIIELLEQECVRREIKLTIVQIDFYSSAESRNALASPAIMNPAIGYVLDVWWNSGDIFRRSHADLLKRLAGLKRPVAILDEVGDFDLQAQFDGNPMMQVFRIDERGAGGRVARLLLGMGHTRVAYISTNHDSHWSTQRLQGIVDQYAKAGHEAGVLPLVESSHGSYYGQLMDMSGFSDDIVKRIARIGRTPAQADDAFLVYQQYKQSVKNPSYDPEDVRRVRRDLAGINLLIDRDIDESVFDRMVAAAVFDAQKGLISYLLRPLFDRALKLRNVSGWICATDQLALFALAFLQEKGVSVPNDISVTGFDNMPFRTLEHRLSSYDFNSQGFAFRMVEFIVRTPRVKGTYRHAPIEVEGAVMHRDTTGPARRGV